MGFPLLTLTGIDDNTTPAWINKMARTYLKQTGGSALEFAILRSPNVGKSPRYPGRDDIRKITSYVYPDKLAFHLCGRYARMVHTLEWAELCDIIDFSLVSRVQVNSTECDEKAMVTLQRFGAHIGKPIIMQWREGVFPMVSNIDLLQDRSGGKGIVESVWSNPDALCRKIRRTIGYAGGLSPENVAAKLPEIIQAAKGNPFWIDCESSLRTNDWFDPYKAEAMIEAVLAASDGRMIKVVKAA